MDIEVNDSAIINSCALSYYAVTRYNVTYTAGSCAQNYRQSIYRSRYESGKYKDKIDQIVDETKCSQSLVSHQLKVLKDADLVKTRKVGLRVYYSLKDGHIKELLNIVSYNSNTSNNYHRL